jgi:hypothetical protein
MNELCPHHISRRSHAVLASSAYTRRQLPFHLAHARSHRPKECIQDRTIPGQAVEQRNGLRRREPEGISDGPLAVHPHGHPMPRPWVQVVAQLPKAPEIQHPIEAEPGRTLPTPAPEHSLSFLVIPGIR